MEYSSNIFILSLLLMWASSCFSSSSHLHNDYSTDEMDEEEYKREAFREYDVDGDGVITKEDVKKFCKNWDKPCPSKEELKKGMEEALRLNHGAIDYPTFLKYLNEKERMTAYETFKRASGGKEYFSAEEVRTFLNLGKDTYIPEGQYTAKDMASWHDNGYPYHK